MKKIMLTIGVLLAVSIVSVFLYVGLGSLHIENRTREQLKQENYTEADIRSINVRHSFANLLLSYNEWSIDVVFADEPTSVYHYTLRDGSIVQSGVSGTTEKEDLRH